MKPTTTTPATHPQHAIPSLGSTVDVVLRRMTELTREYSGLGWVEAQLLFSRKGPSIRYRVCPACFGGKMGVVCDPEGLTLRDATETEVGELEEGLAEGWVQISTYARYRQERMQTVHQATGRKLESCGG